MSLQNTPQDCTADTVDESTAARTRVDVIGSEVSLEAVGFWLAITLPVPTLLLLAAGVSTTAELVTVAASSR